MENPKERIEDILKRNPYLDAKGRKKQLFSDQRDDPGIYRQGDGNLSA